MKPSGYILHRGAISFAGNAGRTVTEKFVAIATMHSENRKTGDMIQIWFLLERVNPVQAVKEGLDAHSICRECPFASGGGCYVNVGQAPLSVWRSFHAGNYPQIEPAEYAAVFSGRKIRFGAYGNPTLLPLSMVKAIAAASAGWTGYFHDWKTNPLAAAYNKYFMASTETADSFRIAQSLKFRAFHASPVQPAGTLECLSETKGQECATCPVRCNGAQNAKFPSIWINPHGSKVAKANAAALAN